MESLKNSLAKIAKLLSTDPIVIKYGVDHLFLFRLHMYSATTATTSTQCDKESVLRKPFLFLSRIPI